MESRKIIHAIFAATIFGHPASANSVSCGVNEFPYCTAMVMNKPSGLITQCSAGVNFTISSSEGEVIFEKRSSEAISSTFIAKRNNDGEGYKSLDIFFEKVGGCLNEAECRKSIDGSETSMKFEGQVNKYTITTMHYDLFQRFGGTADGVDDGSSNPLLADGFTQPEPSLSAYIVKIGEGDFIFIEDATRNSSTLGVSQFDFFEINDEISACLK